MKISASIYSDKKRPLKDVVLDLVAHQVDLLHVDCNDDVSVFEDIKKIRTWCDLPIDLHIITPFPSKYKDLIRDNPVEYVTFQYEDLKEKIELPSNFSGKKGLAVITPTDVSVFQEYEDFDFILVMATIPGQSGGVFDTFNFSKIRKFKKIYPAKSVHVDGGVNGEVSFILRNMGVSSSVSGSYLFNGPSIGHALMNLTKRNVESQFVLRDFMIPLAETPVIHESKLTFKHVLETIEKGKLGFALVVRENNEYVGLVSNADVRKALLHSIHDLSNLNVSTMINTASVGIQETATVNEMLQLIKKYAFPITYLPVLDEAKNAVGIVTFVNLIRGEI
jgi:pentose-5-phosphate-3-epimerase/predicted transcriptional regulator